MFQMIFKLTWYPGLLSHDNNCFWPPVGVVSEGNPPPSSAAGWPEMNQCFPETGDHGFAHRGGPSTSASCFGRHCWVGGFFFLLPWSFWGESPRQESSSPGRQNACRKAQTGRSICSPALCPLSQHKLVPDHMGMPPCWACIAPQKLCSHTGAAAP